MSNYVTTENPIIFLPKLAKIIGPNESLILSLIHFWINPKYCKNFKDDRYWVYNTYTQWQKQLSHLSESTIKRAITNLEKQKILMSQSFSSNPYIKLKWYSIDYEALHKLLPNELIPHRSSMHSDIILDRAKKFTFNQGDQIDRSDCADHQVNLTRSYIETKATTKKTNNSPFLVDSKIEDIKQNKPSVLNEKTVLEREMISIWNKVFEEEMFVQTFDPYTLKLLQFPKRFFSKNLDLWKDYCEKIKSSNFLMGGGGNKWKASFNWAVKEQTVRKVLGGCYTLGDRKIEKKLQACPKIMEEAIIIDPVWKKVTEKLKVTLGEEVHKAWTGKLRYQQYDKELQKVRLVAPTKFIAGYIKDHYMNSLKWAFKETEVIHDIEISNI